MSRDTEFQYSLDVIKKISFLSYSLIFSSDVKWGGVETASVGIVNNKFCFSFGKEFWDNLNATERVFLMLHESYHVLLGHFKRFPKVTRENNIAMDLAVNHTLLRNFKVDKKDLPYLRKHGVWADNIIPDEELLDCLSAEEYLEIVEARNKEMQGAGKKADKGGAGLDQHQRLDPEKAQDILDKIIEKMKQQIEQEITEQTPVNELNAVEEKVKEKLEEIVEKLGDEDAAEDLGLLAGTGTSAAKALEALKKRKMPWKIFAKRFTRQALGDRYNDVWLPNKRIGHLMPADMIIPTNQEIELKNKIKILVFLDTSGSCAAYVKHFVGFTEAMPKELYELETYGFNTQPYKINMKNPVYHSGGTSFSFFQKIYDKHKKDGQLLYAFVFTDGYGTECELSNPTVWHWFMFHKVATYVPSGSLIHNLRDFE